MTAPFWLPDELAEGNAYVQGAEIAPWDKVSLNDEVLPGVCKLVVPMILVRLDDHKQPGFSGNPFVPQGVNNATVDLEWKLLTADDWTKAQKWIPRLWSNPLKRWRGAAGLQQTKQMAPADAANVVPVWTISHPALVESQIGDVAVIGYQPPVDGPEGPQTKILKFRFRQWSPAPRKAPSKTRPAKDNGKGIDATFPTLGTPANQAATPPSSTDTKKRK